MTKATNLKGLAERRSDIFHIPLASIVEEDGWNVRDMDTPDNVDALNELAESIRETGVKEPLTGFFRDGNVVLTNGHRRLRAVKLLVAQGAPIETLPFQSEPRGTDEAGRVASMLVRNSGKSLTPLEASKVVARLVGFDWPVSKIASVMGKTPSYVNQLLQLQEAAPEVKEMVREGTVAAAVAVRTSRREGGVEALKDAVAQAKKDGKRKVTPKAIEKAKVVRKATKTHAAAEADTTVGVATQPAPRTQRQDELLAAAALLLGLAMPARYSTTAPGWWPFSNAQWFKAMENGTLLADAKGHIAQAEAMEDAP